MSLAVPLHSRPKCPFSTRRRPGGGNRRLRRAVPSVLVALAISLTLGCDEDPVRNVPQTCAPAVDAAGLAQLLADTYQRRDFACFRTLFPLPEDNLHFVFNFNDPSGGGVQSWDLDTLLRIHRRMFEPGTVVPGEPPVDPQLRLTSITISLVPISSFVSTTEFDQPAGELDPQVWRAWRGEYHGVVYFDTVTENDYRVDGRVRFVVVENLEKPTGSAGKFVFYRWEDLGTFEAASVEPTVWFRVLAMYDPSGNPAPIERIYP
jgi:hypothetical protein